mgnify:CR=1 FL=1
MPTASPQIKEFTERLTSVNAAEVLLGGSPSKDSLQPVNPETWLQDFDRSTARPSTSRRVSCPTPNQRDDYVQPSPVRDVKQRTTVNRTRWGGRYERHAPALDDDAEDKNGDPDDEFLNDSFDEAPQLVPEDLSLETLRTIVASIRNVTNSADEVLKTYTRHQVIVALLMATNMAYQLTPAQRMAVKMSVVVGRISAAITNFREATRAVA